jgi:hypothetical protein
MRRFKFLFFLTTVLSSNFTFLAKAGLCSSKEAVSGKVLVDVIISESLLLRDFEITPDDTYDSLALKILERLERKKTKDFSSLPLAIQQVLKEKEITELPLGLDVLTNKQRSLPINDFKTGNNLYARLRIALGDSLKGANFTAADLTGANFTDADLRGAVLKDAILYTSSHDPLHPRKLFTISADFTRALVSADQLKSAAKVLQRQLNQACLMSPEK